MLYNYVFKKTTGLEVQNQKTSFTSQNCFIWFFNDISLHLRVTDIIHQNKVRTTPAPHPFLTCIHWLWSLCAAAQALTLPLWSSRAYSGLQEKSSMPRVRCTEEADSWESSTFPDLRPSSSKQPEGMRNKTLIPVNGF